MIGPLPYGKVRFICCTGLKNGTGDPSPTLGSVVGYKYHVTKLINLERNTQGSSVFQRSYYDHVIRSRQDHDEIWEYIKYNPQKWTIKQGRDRPCLALLYIQFLVTPGRRA